jgi:hypothetical protein
MRKLLSCLLLSCTAIVAAGYTGGCGAAAVAANLCDSACLDYNALHCGSQCDCTACGMAPPACDSYYQCIQDNGQSCLSLINCSIPTQCQAFVATNCK